MGKGLPDNGEARPHEAVEELLILRVNQIHGRYSPRRPVQAREEQVDDIAPPPRKDHIRDAVQGRLDSTPVDLHRDLYVDRLT